MKLELYEIAQYSDTKVYYITRLESVSGYGAISRVVIMDGILTKAEARAWLKIYNDHGLRPINELKKSA